MPDFDDLYDVGETARLDEEEDELIWADHPRECAECKQPTHWLSINAHAYLCSTECYTKYWQGFQSAFYRTR